MPEVEDTSETDAPVDFETREEFEALWNSADPEPSPRREGLRELFIYPLVLIYTGLFVGPWGTGIASLVVMKGRMQFRHFTAALGISAAAWLLIQGITAINAPVWSTFWLQFSRSAINFVAGVAIWILIRRQAAKYYAPSRSTAYRTIATFVLLVIAAALIPPSTGINLGR